MSSIGPILDPSLPEQAMLKRLQDFLPVWLNEVDIERGLAPGYTSTPKAFEIVPGLDLSSEPQYPAIFIVSPGAAEQPKREGDGTIRCTWELNVAAFVQGPDQVATEKLAKRYGAAILGCILSKKSFGDPLVRGTDYMGDSYDDLPFDQRRTKQVAYMRFQVEYDHVARTIVPTLPDDPPVDPTDPPPDPVFIPDADHIIVTVDKAVEGG